MTPDETSFFALADKYARTQHHCFLAEMTRDQSGYSLCFRPTRGSIDSPNRYACEYFQASLEEVRAADESGGIPIGLTERLDLALSALGLLI